MKMPAKLVALAVLAAFVSCGGGEDKETTLRRAVDRAPRDIGKRIELAHLLTDKAAYQESITTLLEGQRVVPENIDLLRTLAETYRKCAEASNDTKYWEQAAVCLKQIMQAPGDHTSDRRDLVQALLSSNRLQELMVECVKGLRQNPDDPILLSRLGSALVRQGRYEHGEPLLEKAAEGCNDFRIWWWLADAQRLLGKYQKSLESLKKAADCPPAYRALFTKELRYAKWLVIDKPCDEQVWSHGWLGSRQKTYGRNDLMAAEYETALRMMPPDPKRETWSRIGWCYLYTAEFRSKLGKFDDALVRFQKAIDACNKASNANYLGLIYQCMASVYSGMGDKFPQRQKEFLEKSLAARIREEECIFKANPHGMRHALADKAFAMYRLYGASDDRVKEVRKKLMEIISPMGSVKDCSYAAIIATEALIRFQEHDYEGFKKLAEKVLPSYEMSKNVEDFRAGPDLLCRLALVAIEEGKHDKAIDYCKRGVKHLQMIRSLLGVDEFRREVGGEEWSDMFELMVRAEANKKDYEGVFNSAEDFKARALLDLLASKPTSTALSQPFAACPPAPASPGGTSPELAAPTTDRTAIALRDLDVEQGDYSRLPEDKQSAQRLVKTFENAETLKLNDLEPAFKGITFITYFVGEKRCTAAVVGPDGLHVVTIEQAARQTVQEAVGKFRDSVLEQSKVERDLAIENKPGRKPPERSEARLKQQSERLYALLIEPILPYVKTDIVCISPDGILNNLPFEALQKHGRYLAQDYAVFYAPSANVLKFCMDKNRNRHESILALGNPNLRNAAFRLFNAETEVNALKGLFPKADVFTGDNATETIAKERGGHYDILHFACHGEINPDNPMLTSLRLAPDAANDGYLHAGEIFDLDLPVSLVVLSACSTGLGELTSGNELMGLTRGFLYAGAPAIVASLWTVDDRSTALLMQEFYKNLANMTKVEALRQAKLTVMKQYPNPFYWAAFCLQGDYR